MTFFLLHHAGGDKYAYNRFKDTLKKTHHCISIELPGRGDRFNEPLLSDIHLATEDVFNQIKEKIDGDYCIIGISMGALVTFLVTHLIFENHLPLPKHIYLASRKSINAYKEHIPIAQLNSAAFWEGVVAYGGVSENLIQHKELVELYEPILRADFMALEQFIPKNNYVQLPISASIMAGKEDNISESDLIEWKDYFSKAVDITLFEGGHFFLYENNSAVVDFILSKLK